LKNKASFSFPNALIIFLKIPLKKLRLSNHIDTCTMGKFKRMMSRLATVFNLRLSKETSSSSNVASSMSRVSILDEQEYTIRILVRNLLVTLIRIVRRLMESRLIARRENIRVSLSIMSDRA